MSIGIEGVAALPGVETRAPETTAAASGFDRLLDHLREVDVRIDGAGRQLAALAAGETSNLHQVMLKLEEAKLAFQLTLQVRNKLLEGYQDIMRMQI